MAGLVVVLGACSGSEPGSSAIGGAKSGTSGFGGTYTSVDEDALTMEFKADGTMVSRMGDLGSSAGTWKLDGEKVIIVANGVETTFIRDGDCIEDDKHLFGKLCKGGKAGEAANVSTRNVPATHTGTWIAANEDGEFKIEFKPGNTLTLFVTPAPGIPGKPEALEGVYEVEGDTLYVTLPQSVPMVLKFVNDTYESGAFGLPMSFIRQ